VGSSSLAGKIK